MNYKLHETSRFLEENFESVVKLATDYFNTLNAKNVVPDIKPGSIKDSLPSSIPVEGTDFDTILNDVKEQIIPGLTHWNHPGFMAYFNSTSSGPGIMGEFLSSVFNTNHMVWKSSPASTELEEVTLEWFRDLLGFNKSFTPFIYDTASISTMHALAAARENLNLDIRSKGLFGRSDLPEIVLYCSEHAHSSVDKAAILLGVGMDNIRKIKCDENYSMLPEQLEAAINNDLANNKIPYCVVATIGTTSLTSVDPVNEIADICGIYNIWLHVDSAYAGVTAMLPECRHFFNGVEKADSAVVNPHKWMFVPVDLSVLFIKEKELLERAFSLTAEYLKTTVDNVAVNYMNYGIQLGRRFRALKFWFVMRYYGKSGLQTLIREHIKITKFFAEGIDNNPQFELFSDVNFATVCVRAVPENIEDHNRFNMLLLEKLNNTGKVFLSHTIIDEKYIIRVVFSGFYHTIGNAEDALKLFSDCYESTLKEMS